MRQLNIKEWQEKDASYSSFSQTFASLLEKELLIDKEMVKNEKVSSEELKKMTKEIISKIESKSTQPLDQFHIPPSSSYHSPETHSTPPPPSASATTAVQICSESSESETAVPALLPPEPLTQGLYRKQQTEFDLYLRRLNTQNPSLVLNALDFAGQKMYRLMHHCFISRQALYLVVFDIEEMVKYHKQEMVKHHSEGMVKYCKKKGGSPDPFEELRYWLHSIHAHIGPSEAKKPQEKIFLVGTHKKEYHEDVLDEINELFAEDNDSRYKDHIHRQGNRHFFAVENSIDKESSSNYLKESGIGDLQNQLIETSKELPFLNEDRPLKYLYLENSIKSFLISSEPTPVVNLSKMREVAKRCGLEDGEKQDLAFQFLHDTGKILWLSKFITLLCHDYKSYDFN